MTTHILPAGPALSKAGSCQGSQSLGGGHFSKKCVLIVLCVSPFLAKYMLCLGTIWARTGPGCQAIWWQLSHLIALHWQMFKNATWTAKKLYLCYFVAVMFDSQPKYSSISVALCCQQKRFLYAHAQAYTRANT